MEKAYKISEGKILDDYRAYFENVKKQAEFVKKFTKENKIEAVQYRIFGNGFINKVFEENEKDNIRFEIIPTKNDCKKFEKQLCKSYKFDTRKFKKNSKIGKKIAQECYENKIVINLRYINMGDYIGSLYWGGYTLDTVEHNGKLYIHVNTAKKLENEPENFEEIKVSEFYRIKEEQNAPTS